MRLLGSVFSIKNYEKHKVVKILGLKIKFKRQKFKNLIVQPYLKSLSVHLADHCNLNCCGCDHFSPLSHEHFTDIKDFGSDMKRLSILSNKMLGNLSLIGGEPLLNQQINDFMRISRENFPGTRIKIISNGILLNNQPESFWNSCRKYNIIISLTKYPLNIDYESAEQSAQRYNVQLEFYGNTDNILKTSYHIPLDLDGKQDCMKNFVNCFHANNCVSLKNGKIYPCTVAPNIEHFNNYFNKNIPLTDKDGISIYRAKSMDEILSFVAKPIPFCKYCNVKGRTFGHKWKTSKKEIQEWV